MNATIEYLDFESFEVNSHQLIPNMAAIKKDFLNFDSFTKEF